MSLPHVNSQEWWLDFSERHNLPYLPWREAIKGFLWEFQHPPLWISWTPWWRRHHKECDERFKAASMALMDEGNAEDFKRETAGITYCSTCDYIEASPTKNRVLFWYLVIEDAFGNMAYAWRRG